MDGRVPGYRYDANTVPEFLTRARRRIDRASKPSFDARTTLLRRRHPLAPGLVVLLTLGFSLGGDRASPAARMPTVKPNIVWLVLDDASPNLGAYGDPKAITPNMDRLAREGALFTRAFTHAPVCAPSRSGLVTGMYPTTIGSHHMRSKLIHPPETARPPLRDEDVDLVSSRDRREAVMVSARSSPISA
jgi:hypothetical protein